MSKGIAVCILIRDEDIFTLNCLRFPKIDLGFSLRVNVILLTVSKSECRDTEGDGDDTLANVLLAFPLSSAPSRTD